MKKTKEGPSSMHRQRMLAILEKHLPPSCTVHLKKRLVSYTEPEGEDAHSTSSIRLEFADGTIATADVLIGADGIRSAVRKTMFEAASKVQGDDKTDMKQYIDATFTGMSVYRSLIPAEALAKDNPENSSLKVLTLVSIQSYFMVHPSLYYTVRRKGQGKELLLLIVFIFIDSLS